MLFICFLSMPLCKAVSVHNETQSHIAGLALPGSDVSFFVHLVAALANPAALCALSCGPCCVLFPVIWGTLQWHQQCVCKELLILNISPYVLLPHFFVFCCITVACTFSYCCTFNSMLGKFVLSCSNLLFWFTGAPGFLSSLLSSTGWIGKSMGPRAQCLLVQEAPMRLNQEPTTIGGIRVI